MANRKGYPDSVGLDQLLNLNVNDVLDEEHFDAGLEDELNALLEGKPVPRPSAQAQMPVTRRGAKRQKEYASNTSITHLDSSMIQNMTGVSDDVGDDFNDDDLHDEDLMAELRGIVGNESTNYDAASHPHSTDTWSSVEPVEPTMAKPTRRPAPLPPTLDESVSHSFSPKHLETMDDKTKLVDLRDGYRKAALNSKRAGNSSSAIEMMRIAKQLDIMIDAIANNLPVDMSKLPEPAPVHDSNDSAPTRIRQNPEEHTMLPSMAADLSGDISREDASRLFNAPESASTVLEALNQRLEKYRETSIQAEAKGDSSKVRRIGRIIKQYENAIKACRVGSDFDYSSLPAPLGYPDIPTESKNPLPEIEPRDVLTPIAVKTSPRLRPSTAEAAKDSAKPPNGPKPAPLQRRQSSIHSKQLSYLVERQKLFKEAALEAKTRGDIQQALDYLKQAKGFEPLIEATKCGLPIDATSIPTPPQLADDFVMISKADSDATCDDLSKDELYRKVEIELNDQIEVSNFHGY